MNHLNTYLAHYAGVIAGVCAVLAGMDLSPLGKLGATVAAAASTGVIIAHAIGIKPATIAKAVAPMLLCGLVFLGGCVTFTTAQRSAITTLATAAVVADVEQHGKTPAEKTAQAEKIKGIAVKLQAMDQATLASLPAVIQAVAPLIAAAGLNPAEVILANELVATLQQVLVAQIGTNPSAAQVQTNVQTVLTAVIAACAAYGA